MQPAGPGERSYYAVPLLAMLVQCAAIGVIEDLVDGMLLRDAAARVFGVLRGAEWPEAADLVAGTLRLTALPAV